MQALCAKLSAVDYMDSRKNHVWRLELLLYLDLGYYIYLYKFIGTWTNKFFVTEVNVRTSHFLLLSFLWGKKYFFHNFQELKITYQNIKKVISTTVRNFPSFTCKALQTWVWMAPCSSSSHPCPPWPADHWPRAPSSSSGAASSVLS